MKGGSDTGTKELGFTTHQHYSSLHEHEKVTCKKKTKNLSSNIINFSGGEFVYIE